MHETEFGPPVAHGEKGVAGEHRHQLHEVPVTELAFGADREHSAVLEQDAARQHELDDVVDMLERHRPDRWHRTQPLAPGLAPDAPLLQGEGEELLGEDVKRFRRRHDGFDVSVVPEAEQTQRTQEAVVGRGEEQAVPLGPRPAARSAQPLEEGGDGAGSVDLDDAVEVADIDSQLQRARGDDDTVAALGERLLGTPALVEGERAVGDECPSAGSMELGGQRFDTSTAVAEHQSLFATIERGHHLGRVADAPDVVELGGRRPARVAARSNHPAWSRRVRGKPLEECVRVADGRGKTQTLDLTSGEAADPLQDREQMPAAIVTGERVQLVDDDGLEIAEKHTRFRAGRDEHDLDRLGCGQQHIGAVPA